MLDTTLVWIGLALLVFITSSALFVREYTTANEFSFKLLAYISLSLGGFLELGMANGYIPETRAFNIVSGLSGLLAVVFIGIWVWEHQRKTNQTGSTA
jgi:hypothetical protein